MMERSDFRGVKPDGAVHQVVVQLREIEISTVKGRRVRRHLDSKTATINDATIKALWPTVSAAIDHAIKEAK